jgi:formate dehydrogenase subunit delta
MSPDKLVMMANQIGTFFASQGGEKVTAGIADHIKQFWDPRMRAAIFAYVREGGQGLRPDVRIAVETLARETQRTAREPAPPRLVSREAGQGGCKENLAAVTAIAVSGAIGDAGLLSRGRIFAKTGFNRWLAPPAALGRTLLKWIHRLSGR